MDQVTFDDGENVHAVGPLVKLTIEDDLAAETAKMKKVPGPSWCWNLLGAALS